MEQSKLNKIEFSAGQNIESAYRDLQEYAKEEEEKRQQELKTYKERIPELTTYYKDKARGIIPENKLKYWDRIVPIRLNDLYRGMELDCWLDIIKVLNNEDKSKDERLKECRDLFYKQGHSGMSGFLVLAGLKELHPLGYEVAAYINKRQKNWIMINKKLTDILRENDIIYVGISDEERYKFRVKSIKHVEEEIWTMPHNKLSYTRLKLQKEYDNKNNNKFITDWLRSYAESITGRMSNPIYQRDIKIWNEDGDTVIYEPYKTIIEYGYFGDIQKNEALEIEELVLKLYYEE